MTGDIEIDETYFGGKNRNRHTSKKLKNWQTGKVMVQGLRNKDEVRAKVVSNSFGKTLKKNVVQNVESKSTITTDEHKGYIGLNKEYYHHTINHSIGEYVLFNEITTNGIESVWALMKRGYKGTYHHWSRKHLHRYLNEFAFRLGEGNVKHSTLDRVGSLIQNSNRRLDYKTLTK